MRHSALRSSSANLDQDGRPDLVTTRDGPDDAITVHHVDPTTGQTEVVLRTDAPAPIRALAVCPPEVGGAPALVAVVGAESGWCARRTAVIASAMASGAPTRRNVIGAAAGAVLAGILPGRSFASGRRPYGGRMTLRCPWPLALIDPHRVDDAAAAFFGEALFDTLYVRDEAAGWRSSLADGSPRPEGSRLRVEARQGLRFASGLGLDARIVAGFDRAGARTRCRRVASRRSSPSYRPRLARLCSSRRRPIDARSFQSACRNRTASVLARTARRTGPFRAHPRAGGLLLLRNTLASSGPSLLDAVEILHATDLASSLRAFESGADDVGWLGSFLHEPRSLARAFDAGFVAWAVVRTGRDAGVLDAPGSAQSLADGASYAALAPLVVGPAWPTSTAQWTGLPCDLLVREDSPWLVELARALSASLSMPSREITPRLVSPAELAQRRSSRSYALMLDLVRRASGDNLGCAVGIASADNGRIAIDLGRHPPRGGLSPRTITRTLRIGVVGEVRLQGGRAPDVVLPQSPAGYGLDWGGVFRQRSRPRA